MKLLRAAALLLVISGVSFGATCSALVLNPITGALDCVGSGSSSGTVTSVSFTGGLITVATATTTAALTVAGTSGGIVYFSSASTWASSGVLGANLPLFGGGAGASPIAGTRSGNTTAVVTTTGSQTSGNCVSIDASGNHVANGLPCFSTSDLTGYFALGSTNAVTAVNNTFASSATEASIELTGAAIPSSINAGGLYVTTTGRFGWSDGTNVQHAISIPGSGVTAPSAPGAGVAHFAGSVFTVTSSAVSLSADVTGTLPNASVAVTPMAAGTTHSLTAPREYWVCTGTCTVTPPVPAAGYEFCVMNGDNVSTAITLAALGSSAMYENSARTAYGTAGTGTLVVAAAAANKVCIVGLDATHYLTVSYSGAVTVN